MKSIKEQKSFKNWYRYDLRQFKFSQNYYYSCYSSYKRNIETSFHRMNNEKAWINNSYDGKALPTFMFFKKK